MVGKGGKMAGRRTSPQLMTSLFHGLRAALVAAIEAKASCPSMASAASPR
jgi:hypothetical protein